MYATAQKKPQLCRITLEGAVKPGNVKYMTEENGTGSNAVWAIALIIVVAIIGAVVYYSGVLKQTGSKKADIDINVTAPAAPAR